MHIMCGFECPAWGYERPTVHFSLKEVWKTKKEKKHSLQQQCIPPGYYSISSDKLFGSLLGNSTSNLVLSLKMIGKNKTLTDFAIVENYQENSGLKKLTKTLMVLDPWYLKHDIKFNSSRQTLTWEYLGFVPYCLNEWLNGNNNNNNNYYNYNNNLSLIKWTAWSLCYECLNIMSPPWLMWPARKTMFTEGWKFQEVKITKWLLKKMTNITQWLRYSEVTPDLQ